MFHALVHACTYIDSVHVLCYKILFSFWYMQPVNPETGAEVADNEVCFNFVNLLLLQLT